MKKLLKMLSNKGAITAISLLLDVAIVVLLILLLGSIAWWSLLVFYVLGVIVSFYIVSKDENPAYKLSMVVLILGFPIVGLFLYLFLGREHVAYSTRKKMYHANNVEQVLLNHKLAENLSNGMTSDSLIVHPCALYVENASSFPAYRDTKTKYFALGDDVEEQFLADLASAKKFIFLEYFIIEPGEFWDAIEEILIEKAKAGVDVKVLYDDMGCIMTLKKRRINYLRENGVKIVAFNPIHLSFDMRYNNRSHRKITVIDGKIAYTGGINLADEYVNKTVKHGHWKDTVIRFEGAAIYSFIIMFLSFWMVYSNESLNYADYLSETQPVESTGCVQPLTSGPGRLSQVIENSVLSIISHAKRFIYINTPYLILDNEMVTALCNAARSGVDVRITMPRIPDKKMVFHTSRSFYPQLVKAGVRIFEYLPGFVHAKSVVADDSIAYIGSCNMDYRSFYLHYEVGAILYDTDTIPQMTNDYLKTLEKCEEMTIDRITDDNAIIRFGKGILRWLAPLF